MIERKKEMRDMRKTEIKRDEIEREKSKQLLAARTSISASFV